ncbi:hypothetical protein J3R83DRAFT_2449 [Lanmaoa asiatica]|nr:hypothetical protein J3R83DRAFT_2449 [Lanmaoa asiatica]
MAAGEPSTTGYGLILSTFTRLLMELFRMTATTSDGTCQCRWLTGGRPCSQSFADFQYLIVHLNRVHDVQGSAARKLVCQWLTDNGRCGKEYRRGGYKRHIGTHLGYSVPCTECDKHFSREDSMRAHRKKKHGKK